MDDATSYWTELCQLIGQDPLLFARVGFREGGSTLEGHWSQLLIVRVPGYLEGAGGPTPIRDVDWVEVAPVRVRGGMAGRALELIDLKAEMLERLKGTQFGWELRQTTWSVTRVFEEKPVEVFHFANPFAEPSGL